MKIVQAVQVLFPTGNGQDEGTLSAAADALRGLPELTDEQADAVDDAVWPYDDFRENPDEWMEGKEADASYPFWKQLAEGGEGTGDDDSEEEEDEDEEDSEEPDEEDDSDDESEDVDPGDDEPSPDAMEGMDADAIAALAAAATPGTSTRPTHNLSDLFDDTDDDPDDERKKKLKKKRRSDDDEGDDDDEFRELKLEERRVKLAHNQLTLEERRRKLHGEEKPKEQLRVPRCVVPVLANPTYLELALKVLKHAKRARDEDPLKVIKARGKLAKIRTKSEALRWETSDSSERAVHEQVLAMLDAVAAGDDVTRPNWFKGNFITGHWIAD